MFLFSRKAIILIISLLLNHLLLQAQCAESHQISTSVGDTALVLTCPNDGRSDEVVFQSNIETDQYFYILTNESGLIIDVKTLGTINFERANQDIIKVYGVAYEGERTALVGQMLESASLADSCFSLSNNFITIQKSIPDAGTISSANDRSDLSFCPEDPTLAAIPFQHSGDSLSPYAYLLVDTNNVILRLSNTSVFPLNDLVEGNYAVYGLAYRGTLLDIVGTSLADDYLASDCYALSDNAVTLTLAQPATNTISLSESDQDTLLVCETLRNIELTNSISASDASYAYIIQDELGVVVDVLDNQSELDANMLPAGIFRLTGIAYTHELSIAVGDNWNDATIAKSCFTISDNSITLIKNELEVGRIQTTDGVSNITSCGSSTINLVVESESESPVIYILTDENNIVEGIQTTASFDLVSTTANQKVFAASYTGALTLQIGDELLQTPIATGCYDLSDNFVSISQLTPKGGNIAFRGGETASYACPGTFGEKPFWIEQENHNTAFNYTFLLIDEQSVIQAITENGLFVMSEEKTGRFTVQGISHLLPLSVALGDTITNTTVYSGECYELAENTLSLYWTEPSAGIATTAKGDTTAFACPNTLSQLALSTSGAIGNQYAYALVDSFDRVLSYTSDTLILDSLAVGRYSIYGISYTGQLSIAEDQNLFRSSLSSACFDITESPVVLNVQAPIETLVATSTFEETLSFCTNGATTETIRVVNTGDGSTRYAYLLTDENNRLLAISHGDSVAIADEIEGDLRIWGVSYTGNLTIGIGADITTTALSDECDQLSMNAIEVELERAKPLKISTFQQEDEVAICYGDGVPDYIGFYTLETVASNFKFLVTDANDVIIQILNGNIQDFERTGPSVVKVWGVEYTGTFTGRIGQFLSTANLATECFSLSENFVTITRSRLEAGTLTINGSTDNVALCTSSEETQYFMLNNLGAIAAEYSYIITNENEDVIAITQADSIDLGKFNIDLLRVWGIAHQTDLLLDVGDNLNTSMIAMGCYELTKNEVTVEQQLVDGGSINDISGSTSITLCPNDELPDIVVLRNNSNTSQAYRYVVVDTSGVVIGLPNGVLQSFTRFDEGQYRIYGISFTGDLNLSIGDTLANQTLATGCYGLSDNYISVNKTTPSIDEITTLEGGTSAITYVGDGEADSIQFQVTGISSNVEPLLIVTNTQRVIVGIATGSYDFDALSVGFYRVYGATYTGNIILKAGDVFDGTVVSTGCFDVADNYVQIICAPGVRSRSNDVTQNDTGIEMHPNPIQNISNIVYQVLESGAVQLEVFDAVGRLLIEQQTVAQEGENRWTLDGSNLNVGWYTLRITTKSSIKTLSFSKLN